MLQFLQTGKMLYVFGLVCVLGSISKLVTGSFYKRMIRETGNMALTKSKNLKAFRQKTENAVLVSQGIRNVQAYIEKQMYSFRFMKLSMENWDKLSTQAMILCFLIGGAAAFGAYWYRCDSYYIVLYGTVGILSGLFLVLVDNGVNITAKRQQLADCLTDYVENSPYLHKNVDKKLELTAAERKSKAASGILKPRLREAARVSQKAEAELAAGTENAGQEEAAERAGRFHIERTVSSKEKNGSAREERQGSRLSVLSGKKEQPEEAEAGRTKNRKDAGGGEDELFESIEQLRQSLEQIAAGREQPKQESRAMEKVKKELRPEDLALLRNILEEYLT